MAITRLTKPALTAGKLSARLFGRFDLEQRLVGAEDIQNFLVFPHGGATFRSGTYFVNGVKNHADEVRLLPFVFSNTQAYILEVGPSYTRVYFDHAPLLDGSLNHIELATPWTAGQLDNLDWAQSNDILYAAHLAHQPREIRRTGASSWTTGLFNNTDGPYYDANRTATTFTLSATSGSVTLTASSIVGINDGTGFKTTDVGRHVRILHGSTWGWGKITAFTSTTVVTMLVERTFGAVTATTNWRLGAWSNTDGWPEAVVFHQQRLCFARGDYVWGSVTADFANFAPSDAAGVVTTASAFTYRLPSGNRVLWMRSARTLEVGMQSLEYVLSGAAGANAPLTPDTPRASREATEGSTQSAKPINTSNGTMFCNRTGRKLINFYYSFQKDGYEAKDVTLFSEDITDPGIVRLAYQAEPDRLIWAKRSDNTLAVLTFYPQQQVEAWQEVTIAGTFGSGAARVEDVCVIPSPDGTRDDVWVVVARTVNGNTRRYIEYLLPLFGPRTAVEDGVFLDSALTYSGAPVTTVTGLTHLEGQTVGVLADGFLLEDEVVTGGQISITRPSSKIHVGLRYTGFIDMLSVEPQAAVDAIGTERTNVRRVGLQFYRTVLAKVGVRGRPLETVGRRTAAEPLGSPIQPKSDYRVVTVDSGSEYRNVIRVEQDLPVPCTVLSITAYLEIL